jgi:hypothetical protein
VPKLPKTPARDDYFTQSFRFTPEQTAVIKEEAKRCGSTTAFVRELIDDHRTFFGLPQMQVEFLERDMRALKLPSHREYLRHLLSLRLQSLPQARGAGAKSTKR